MSINPEYVNKIMQGTKKFEYRKTRCKREITEIIIYCTAPVCKVVGTVKVKNILEEEPEVLWNKTKEDSGTDYAFYRRYFEGREKGIAYQLGKVTEFKKQKNLSYYNVKAAPQSYIYIEQRKNKFL